MSAAPETLSPPARAASLGPVWLFSAPVDLAAFGGSAAVALALVAAGAAAGWLDGDAPEWTWVTAVLLIDVAHVYATGFRVYFDPAELRRRPWLYGLTPALTVVIGSAVYSESPALFWRLLAYLAVFHFVRQQYGWVALYRARAGERDRLGRWADSAAIYAATVYPLVYWHAHLPRRFWWFLEGDFAALPGWTARAAGPVYWSLLALYAARSLYRAVALGRPNPGKDLVVLTTAACWYVGIVALDSDFAFTVTNVIIHGVPYLVLVYWHRSRRGGHGPGRPAARVAGFLAAVWALAYVEELLWDRGVWHERAWLFGGAWDLGGADVVFVPLLAVPQVTHYVLDGFLWRRRDNPDVRRFAAGG